MKPTSPCKKLYLADNAGHLDVKSVYASALLTSERLSFFFFLIHFSMEWLVRHAQSPWPQAHSSSFGWNETATVSQVLSLDISHQPQLWLQDSKSLQPIKVWKKSLPQTQLLFAGKECQTTCSNTNTCVAYCPCSHILCCSVVWSHVHAGKKH